MKILFNTYSVYKENHFKANTEYEVKDDLAKQFIDIGVAIKCVDKKKRTKKNA